MHDDKIGRRLVCKLDRSKKFKKTGSHKYEYASQYVKCYIHVPSEAFPQAKIDMELFVYMRGGGIRRKVFSSYASMIVSTHFYPDDKPLYVKNYPVSDIYRTEDPPDKSFDLKIEDDVLNVVSQIEGDGLYFTTTKGSQSTIVELSDYSVLFTRKLLITEREINAKEALELKKSMKLIRV